MKKNHNAYTTAAFADDIQYGGMYWEDIAKVMDEREHATPGISVAGPPQ